MIGRLNHAHGFSIVETLAVLALAGISLSMAVPGLRMLVRGDSSTTAVNRLVGTMQMARSAAVTGNTRITVCPSADGQRCDKSPWQDGWIAFTDPDQDRQIGPGEKILIRESVQPGLQFRSREFEHAFSYRPNGQIVAADASTNSGQFILCEAGADTATRVVVVPPSGEPRLAQKPIDGDTARCEPEIHR